jgi:uncharacterized protein (TIGR02246 family)
VSGELEALERRGWEALTGTSGAAFYEELMADDGVMVFPGMILDKAETIRAIADAPPWQSFELAEVRVIEVTPDSGIVTYDARARRADEDEYRALMSSVYARRERRWRLLLHQQSPAPPTGKDS